MRTTVQMELPDFTATPAVKSPAGPPAAALAPVTTEYPGDYFAPETQREQPVWPTFPTFAEALRLKVGVVLGRDLRTQFSVVNVSENVLYELSLEAAQNRALGERSEIRAARLQQRQAELQRRLRQAERLPDVSLTMGYFAPPGTAVLPRQVFGAGVAVKWEPFDWGRKRRELAETEKSLAQSDNALREAEAQVLLDVNARFRKLEEARALLRVVQIAQQAAQEKLRVASNKFKQEAALLKDVLQTQAAVADANHQYQQALLALLTARADFEKAIGE
ncbi:MAG: TolC family protein [Acidobacteria bacterium]|nr:TolC family protein [Acidobacteriota bacterium]MBI3426917.1 TolC family protein [Acidobacteriota bacterium]